MLVYDCEVAVRKSGRKSSAVVTHLCPEQVAHQLHGMHVEVGKTVVFLTHLHPSSTLFFSVHFLPRDFYTYSETV